VLVRFARATGISEGPWRAPSSPPDTPEPMKHKPVLSKGFFAALRVFEVRVPPSINMSPSSSKA